MRILSQHTHHSLSRLVAFVVAAALALSPVLVEAGQRRGGASGRSGGGQGGGGGARVGTATPRGGGDSARGSGGSGGGSTRTSPGGSRTEGRSGGNSDGARATARQRDGQPVVGEAVPRRGYGGGGGTTVIVPGGYYGGFLPWGFGGFGLAGYYGGGFYDPWFYGGQPYGYGGGFGGGYVGGYADGALRLKVKPRDATVLVDGYFAGQVDDFDGVFQRLRLEPGPHRIEVSADGYEPLTFEIRVLPDRTTTYKGELTRIQ
jgi:hypothetical protein